ncbi:MAG TPA: hypothetical protein PLF22_10265 [Pseudomonadales bacterium]|nr:hypothetical protein [Pseudomonadales bacterium]
MTKNSAAIPENIPWHWLPAIVTAAVVFFYHLDVPYFDQWDLLPLLDAFYQHHLALSDLLVPHNGHILFLPQLLMLLLAWLTHWNTFAEVIAGFVFASINGVLLLKLAGHAAGSTLTWEEKLPLTLLAFSLTQAQNWIWGWQLQVPMAMLFVLLGFCSFVFIQNLLRAFLCAAICAIAASLSFGAGLLFWFAALPLLAARHRVLAVVWLVVALLFCTCYVQWLAAHSTGSTLPDTVTAGVILAYAANTAACLGNLIARSNMLAATLVGGAGCLLFFYHYRKLPGTRHLLLAAFIFAAGNACLISLSRTAIGDPLQMLSSRYGTAGLPFWTLLAILQIRLVDKSVLQHAINAALLIALLASGIDSLKDMQLIHNRQQKGITAMQAIATGNTENLRQLPAINPRADQTRAVQEVKMLQQYRLSYFRNR